MALMARPREQGSKQVVRRVPTSKHTLLQYHEGGWQGYEGYANAGYDLCYVRDAFGHDESAAR